MKSDGEKQSAEMAEAAIDRLFRKFCQPMVQPCANSSQEESAVGIAKILWLRLVSDTDTEQNIYTDLKSSVGTQHDSIVALGSMYFYKMKSALKEAEIRQVKDYYADDRNFQHLETWSPWRRIGVTS